MPKIHSSRSATKAASKASGLRGSGLGERAAGAPNPAFERNLSYRLSMLHFLLGRSTAEIYAAEDLTIHQWKVMSVVCQFAPIPATEVQDWVTLDKSAISRAVRLLVEQDLIERQMHGTDGRAIDLVPSRQGKAVNARVVRKTSALQQLLLAGLPAATAEALFHAFDHIEGELRDRQGSGPAITD
jgi:DNA-binding MarR family transcriptional regulator